ncbi:hypothetical protein [Fusobacterium phage Fnu1]|uniref:Uncharacterized protein n=1 Tax=Fusobacterium phage Fnu1 TaxID=2530024 RepID=A0A481W5R3_9CAUD|nr:hypothetical protein KMD24_gp039 [Fusobacterium phage Fnu1]QBJ04214.1 hypothetical protein [Fusobacterium phage Fnu1]
MFLILLFYVNTLKLSIYLSLTIFLNLYIFYTLPFLSICYLFIIQCYFIAFSTSILKYYSLNSSIYALSSFEPL